MSLQLHHISKSFPGVRALDDVSLEIISGEVHAVCGENGAGKSTLMNIVSGNLKPDTGTIAIGGKAITFDSVADAFSNGVAIVHQHLSLLENLSVAENIFAGQLPGNQLQLIDYKKLKSSALELLQRLHIDGVRPQTIVSKLSPGHKQLVEIAKALSHNPRYLILDEPTASVGQQEVDVIFSLVRRLRQDGIGIIYISHRLSEVFDIADRVSVLKDGRYQGTLTKENLTREALIRLMVGREFNPVHRQRSKHDDQPLLEVRNFSGDRFSDISFSVRRGEIVGIAGLLGAGRSELMRAIVGADPVKKGIIKLSGENKSFGHVREAIDAGFAFLPEDRKSQGIFAEMSIVDNTVASSLASCQSGGLYREQKAKSLAWELKEKLRIAAQDLSRKISTLSGGNQQKVVLAKCLLTDPQILIADEPTHGVDIGAKHEIYQILTQLAEQGKAVIIVSSELPELLTLCDRILVMRSGKLTGALNRDEATEEKIIALATQ